MQVLLVLVVSLAGQLPPAADSSHTGFSCTVNTLISGKDCVFESDAAQAAVRDSLGKSFPQGAVDLCEKEFGAAAQKCGVKGQWQLVDASGRFAPTALACYRALAHVLQRTSVVAVTSSRCCGCLSTQCKGTVARCYASLAKQSPEPADRTCMRGACSQECANAL